MEKLFISPTPTTPEIHFSVEDNIFRMSGTSRPEDARAMYYPVIDWIKELTNNILNGKIDFFSVQNPLRFQVDLLYFNSSSAKFLYDIFIEIKRIPSSGIPVSVEWHHEKEDTDMLDAGNDIALLVDMEFTYVIKDED